MIDEATNEKMKICDMIEPTWQYQTALLEHESFKQSAVLINQFWNCQPVGVQVVTEIFYRFL